MIGCRGKFLVLRVEILASAPSSVGTNPPHYTFKSPPINIQYSKLKLCTLIFMLRQFLHESSKLNRVTRWQMVAQVSLL